jgi:hypothetical protein
MSLMHLWELADLSTPWSLFVVATLRIADRIEAGTTDIEQLAAESRVHAESLQRVLRQLVSKGVFEEPAPGRFALNEPARQLLGKGRIGFDLDGWGGRMIHAWSTLLSAVRTGKPAYHEIFGRSYWDDLNAHPEIAAEFDDMMGPAGHGTPDPDVLPDPADWPKIQTVVDVGGGTGSQLAEVLRTHPHLRGILVDLPRTVARSHEMFGPAGVSDRVTLSAQSFFDPIPAGHDLYLLKSVLADWPDAEAQAILTRCAEAARPNGRVVAVNGVQPQETASPELLMLILVGGKQRSLAEFRTLATAAGLEVTATAQKPSGRFLVECRVSRSG